MDEQRIVILWRKVELNHRARACYCLLAICGMLRTFTDQYNFPFMFLSLLRIFGGSVGITFKAGQVCADIELYVRSTSTLSTLIR